MASVRPAEPRPSASFSKDAGSGHLFFVEIEGVSIETGRVNSSQGPSLPEATPSQSEGGPLAPSWAQRLGQATMQKAL